jgi:hypothetical protein
LPGRVSADIANQRAISAGSVMAFQTTSGVAWISRTCS